MKPSEKVAQLTKDRFFLLAINGQEIEVQMNDGTIFTQEQLVKSQSYYSDDEVSFFSCSIDTFFAEIGTEVTLRFLREVSPYTAEQLAEMDREEESSAE